MLIGNRNIFLKSPAKTMAGTTVSDCRSNWGYNGRNRNRYVGEAYFTKQDGQPIGYQPPYCYILPQKDGGIASIARGTGLSTLTINLAGGKNAVGSLTGNGVINAANIKWLIIATASLTGNGTINANIKGLVNLIANLVGTGIISDADLKLYLLAVAALIGNGTVNANIKGALYGTASLTGNGIISSATLNVVLAMVASLLGTGTLDADIVGKWNTIASLTGNGIINPAIIKGVGNLIKNLTGSGIVSNSDMRAIANIIANVTPYTTLSPENLANKVWESLATNYNNTGTMGEKLNSAGSAGNPWTDVATYGSGTKGELIQLIYNLIDELHKLEGLDIANPVTVTPTSRVVGAIEQEITGDGVTTTTVTRQ